MTDLAKLVGEDAEHLWSFCNYYKLYYKDSEPYGIIGSVIDNDMTVLYSMSRDEGVFSVGMLRDIIKLYKRTDIALVTDKEYAYEYIQKALKPYGFTFHFAELESGQKFMYSIHIKQGD